MEQPWWLMLDADIFKRLQKLLCAAYLTCKDIDSGDEAYVWPDEDVRGLVVKAYDAIVKHNRKLFATTQEARQGGG